MNPADFPPEADTSPFDAELARLARGDLAFLAGLAVLAGACLALGLYGPWPL